jgi:hypothetical protein
MFTTIQRKEVPVKWAFFLTARRPHKMIPRFTMRQLLSEPDLLGNALVTPPLPAWRRLQRVPSSHSALARAAVRIYNHGTRQGGDGLEGRQGQWRTQPSRIRSGSISPLELASQIVKTKAGHCCSARASWKSEGDYRPLDSGSAMLSNERISASMPNLILTSAGSGAR